VSDVKKNVKSRFNLITRDSNYSRYSTKVFGAPYEYNPMIDMLHTTYNKTVGSNFSLLHLVPGEMTTSGVVSQFIKKVANVLPGVVFDGRNAKFNERVSEYFTYVKAMHYFTYSSMLRYDKMGTAPPGKFGEEWLLDQTFSSNIIKANKDATSLLSSLSDRANSNMRKSVTEDTDTSTMSAKVKAIKAVNYEIDRYLNNFNSDERIGAISELLSTSNCKVGDDGDASCSNTSDGRVSAYYSEYKKELLKKINELKNKSNKIENQYKEQLLTALKDSANNTTVDKVSSVYNESKKRRKDAVGQSYGFLFYADAAAEARDNISTSYIENSNASIQNQSSMANRQNDANTVGNVGLGAATFSSVKTSLMNLVNRAKMMGSVTAASTTLGEQINMALIWSNTHHSKTYNIDFNFVSPYGDPHSIYENVFFPLIMLMCMALPRRGSVFNAYQEPFIVRAEIPGNFVCDMGYISNISWHKGSKSTWSVDGLPLAIHVTLTINDIFPTISMTDDISEISENGALALYLVNMVGLVSHDTVDNFSWRGSGNRQKWSDYVSKDNVISTVSNQFGNLAEKLLGSSLSSGMSK